MLHPPISSSKQAPPPESSDRLKLSASRRINPICTLVTLISGVVYPFLVEL